MSITLANHGLSLRVGRHEKRANALAKTATLRVYRDQHHTACGTSDCYNSGISLEGPPCT